MKTEYSVKQLLDKYNTIEFEPWEAPPPPKYKEWQTWELEQMHQDYIDKTKCSIANQLLAKGLKAKDFITPKDTTDTITDYCIIDVVEKLDRPKKKAVALAKSKLPPIGEYIDLYTLTIKQLQYNSYNYPSQQNIDRKRDENRKTLNPKAVIFLCNEITYHEKELKMWADRVDQILIIECSIEYNAYSFTIFDYFKDIEPTLNHSHITQRNQEYLQIAETWARPLGYTFDYPLHRDPKPNELGLNVKSMLQRTLDKDPAMKDKSTNISTKQGTFLQSNCTVATNEELENFMKYYEYCKAHGIENYLDIDFAICPKCGHPIKLSRIKFKIEEYPNKQNYISYVPQENEVFCHCGWYIPFSNHCSNKTTQYFDDTGRDFPNQEDETY